MQAHKLSEKALEARRKWQREWNAKNPDKVQEYKRRYWEKKGQDVAGTIEKEDEKS